MPVKQSIFENQHARYRVSIKKDNKPSFASDVSEAGHVTELPAVALSD